MPSTWNAITAFSEECVEKLVHGVLLLYLVVSSALAIGSCKSEKRAARRSANAAINFTLVFNNNHGRSLPTL